MTLSIAFKAANRLAQSKSGATAIEYGLIVALIAIGIITTLQGMSGELNSTFHTTSSAMASTSA